MLNPKSRNFSNSIQKFWFNEIEKSTWFNQNATIDELIRIRFRLTANQALQGRLEHWLEDASALLSYILLLDQFTRNIYRNNPRAFASDNQALKAAEQAISLGALDQEANQDRRNFYLMPFMHSEDLATQEVGLEYFRRYCDDNTIDFAKQHLNIIARFGRFPHRNEILGRVSSQAEINFLKEEHTGF